MVNRLVIEVVIAFAFLLSGCSGTSTTSGRTEEATGKEPVAVTPSELLKRGFVEVLGSPGLFHHKQITYGDLKLAIGFEEGKHRWELSPAQSPIGPEGWRHYLFSKLNGISCVIECLLGDVEDSTPLDAFVSFRVE